METQINAQMENQRALSLSVPRLTGEPAYSHRTRTNWLKETAESRLSGAQLYLPSTLQDYLVCMDQTRKMHRAPACLNSRDAALEEIKNRLDLLAGLFSRSAALETAMQTEVF